MVSEIVNRKRYIEAALTALLLCVPSLVFARVDIDPRPITWTLNWLGTNLNASQDFCVQSTQGPNPADTTPIPYAVSATVPFVLTNGAGDQIPVSLSWQDLSTASSPVALISGGTTGNIMTGKIANCPGGNNGRLIMFIDNNDITAVPPGNYTQTFDITVSNTGAGRSSFSDPVTVNLTLPDSIAVTQLDDISLGNYAGVDMSANESLCVFRAGGAANSAYGVTMTGSGIGGAFTLQRNASVLPYSVTWNDGSGAAAVTPGALLSARINARPGSLTCNAGANNNATLGVSVLATDVDSQVTEAGYHSGSITILVEMQ